MKKQIVTAALPYANGPLHIGHLAGCYLPSDIYVRFQKAKGNDVVFVCGSDEHGVPISLRAKAEGKTPQQVVDHYHALMKNTFTDMGIHFDVYSRTSSNVHHETAQAFFKNLYEKEVFVAETSQQLYDAEAKQFLADRYVTGTCPNCAYEKAYGDQCENCGKALSPDELINPTSALTGNKPVTKDTTNWYLPLDKMQPQLEKYIDSKKGIWKNSVYGQCKSWLTDGLRPRAMTRDLDWGVKLPIQDSEGKVMYVWFDAPIGYISATKELLPRNWESYWKDKDAELIHFIGKDNIVFHCIIFPAMLMAEGSYTLPSVVPANEFLNLEGDKISTSRNYAVWVHEYLEDFNNRADEMRYVLCSIAPENKDADFSWADFQARVNNELVAIFGNFVNRVSVLTQKYYEGIVPAANIEKVETQLWQDVLVQIEAIESNISDYKFRDALSNWINLSRLGNKYLADQEPWKKIKTDQKRTDTIMCNAINLAALIGVYSKPFLPQTFNKLNTAFGIGDSPLAYNSELFKEGAHINKVPLLFQQITDEEINVQLEKLTPPSNFNLKPMIQYDDFAKMQLVSATIKEAKKVENADKLLQITLSISDQEDKTVLSGIAMHYTPEEIVGKQVTYLANLAPRKMRGILSEGMILMAESEGKLIFVSPEENVKMEVRLRNLIVLVLALILVACNNDPKKKVKKGKEDAVQSVTEGEKLARSYCQSCHLFVPPGILDKKTWKEGVFPAMGPRMGIFEHNGVVYPDLRDAPNVADLYPSQPAMSAADWQKIIDYYIGSAPENPAPQGRSTSYTPDLSIFDVSPLNSNNVSPIITLVKMAKNGGFFIYDANSTGLAKMDKTGTPELFAKIENPISNVIPYKKGYLFTHIGSIFPSDIWKGKINYVSINGKSLSFQKEIRSEVERPVMVKLGDLNGDGEEDIVVCGYGHNKGDFYWLDGKTYKKTSIKNISGAISTQVMDYDKDGDLDLFTLFAQGTEKIIYFENDGNGKFKETTIKEFMPVRGSTSFQIVDINKDGNYDILYTCGDNADFSVIFKSFHGVYVYLGNGGMEFKESYFYPMNGAFKAMTSDFDGDGDLDIAAISFFADYVNQPYEGFLYFEQTEKMKFKVMTEPETYKGRWLTMDVGDVDLDGDDDIVLGNFSMGPTNMPEVIRKTWSSGPAAMLLINNSERK